MRWLLSSSTLTLACFQHLYKWAGHSGSDLIIPAHRMLRQKDHPEMKVSLGYGMRPYLRTTNKWMNSCVLLYFASNGLLEWVHPDLFFIELPCFETFLGNPKKASFLFSVLLHFWSSSIRGSNLRYCFPLNKLIYWAVVRSSWKILSTLSTEAKSREPSVYSCFFDF